MMTADRELLAAAKLAAAQLERIGTAAGAKRSENVILVRLLNAIDAAEGRMGPPRFIREATVVNLFDAMHAGRRPV